MSDENYYELEDGIQEGLSRMVNSESSEEFCNNAKAVKDLYGVKIDETKVEYDNYNNCAKLDRELEIKNRINPNTVITCGTGIVLTLATMLYESDGHLFKWSDIGKITMGLFSRRQD